MTQTWAKNLAHVLPLDQFTTMPRPLPQVVFVEGSDMLGDGVTQRGSAGGLQAGQAFVATVVSEVHDWPQWPHTAMFFSYDEQAACRPRAAARRVHSR